MHAFWYIWNQHRILNTEIPTTDLSVMSSSVIFSYYENTVIIACNFPSAFTLYVNNRRISVAFIYYMSNCFLFSSLFFSLEINHLCITINKKQVIIKYIWKLFLKIISITHGDRNNVCLFFKLKNTNLFYSFFMYIHKYSILFPLRR